MDGSVLRLQFVFLLLGLYLDNGGLTRVDEAENRLC